MILLNTLLMIDSSLLQFELFKILAIQLWPPFSITRSINWSKWQIVHKWKLF